MLNLKSAHSLGRAEMKKLLGGNDNTSRLRCADQCLSDPNTGDRYCPDNKQCINYACTSPLGPNLGYRCQ